MAKWETCIKVLALEKIYYHIYICISAKYFSVIKLHMAMEEEGTGTANNPMDNVVRLLAIQYQLNLFISLQYIPPFSLLDLYGRLQT